MKLNPIRITTFFVVAVICTAALLLIAAAPYQGAEPEPAFDITALIVSIIAAVVGYVAAKIQDGKLFARAQVGPQWAWLINDAANIAVKAAQQQFSENIDKRTYAVNWAADYLAKLGMKVDRTIIIGAIEAAVHDLNYDYSSEISDDPG